MTGSVPQKPANGELTAAVEREDVDAVRDLLERGADVEDADMYGYTALMQGVNNGPEIVGLLVDWGADPFRKNSDGDDAWSLLEEDFDMFPVYPRPESYVEVDKILRESPKRRRLFLEERAKADEAKASSAANTLLEKRKRLEARAPKVKIAPKP